MFTIYHNPRCSKSRQTLALLEQHGVTPKVVEYLKTPLTIAELKIVLSKLKMSARQVLRDKEAVYKDLNLGDTTLSDSDLLTALQQNPKLLERPIVVHGDHAVIGRPPENVLSLL